MSISTPNGVNGGNAATNSALSNSGSTSASGSVGGLTMNDFLTLMTAQLQNQDPLDPTDANEFLSQLSELSTVEGISQLNSTLTSLSGSMLSSQALSSAALVGQNILAAASSANYVAGSPLNGAVQLPTGATATTVTISDQSGNVVQQMALPVSSSGYAPFSWNGVTTSGVSAPTGTYNVSATAVVGGQSQSATTLLTGTVSSVTLSSSGSGVELNTSQLGPVALSSVQQID